MVIHVKLFTREVGYGNGIQYKMRLRNENDRSAEEIDNVSKQ